MSNRYKWVVIAYIFGQLIIPFVIALGAYSLLTLDQKGILTFSITEELISALSVALGSAVALIATIFLMKEDIREDVAKRGWMTSRQIASALLGVLLLFVAQYAAAMIEMMVLGINTESENTQAITDMIKNYPVLFLFPAIYAPILEEIIFRKFLMGGLKKRFGFWPAIIISSLLFGIMHLELTHLLVYTSLGFVLGYLYHKTDKIAVPMLAHGIMNILVVVMQFYLV